MASCFDSNYTRMFWFCCREVEVAQIWICRKCNFEGCDRADLQPTIVNGSHPPPPPPPPPPHPTPPPPHHHHCQVILFVILFLLLLLVVIVSTNHWSVYITINAIIKVHYSDFYQNHQRSKSMSLITNIPHVRLVLVRFRCKAGKSEREGGRNLFAQTRQISDQGKNKYICTKKATIHWKRANYSARSINNSQKYICHDLKKIFGVKAKPDCDLAKVTGAWSKTNISA